MIEYRPITDWEKVIPGTLIWIYDGKGWRSFMYQDFTLIPNDSRGWISCISSEGIRVTYPKDRCYYRVSVISKIYQEIWIPSD